MLWNERLSGYGVELRMKVVQENRLCKDSAAEWDYLWAPSAPIEVKESLKNQAVKVNSIM